MLREREREREREFRIPSRACGNLHDRLKGWHQDTAEIAERCQVKVKSVASKCYRTC